MSTISPVERIQKKVQDRLAEEFIDHLLTACLNSHTRRRTRPGCYCPYCRLKTWTNYYVGTTKIESVKKYIANAFTYMDGEGNRYWRYYETCLFTDTDEIREAIKKDREDKRIEARRRLKEEKERIL